MNLYAPFDFGHRVFLDGEEDTPMRIVAYSHKPSYVQAQCAYFFNGEQKEIWVDVWRLRGKNP